MMLKRRVWLRYWHALASGHCELYEAGDELMSIEERWRVRVFCAAPGEGLSCGD